MSATSGALKAGEASKPDNHKYPVSNAVGAYMDRLEILG